MVWSRPAFVLPPTNRPPAASIDTVEFHVNEALTNLYVGLHRHLRGEDLTAMRFIQVYAVDRILALVRLSPTTVLDQPDPFEATRRIESAEPAAAWPLADMVSGFADNVERRSPDPRLADRAATRPTRRWSPRSGSSSGPADRNGPGRHSRTSRPVLRSGDAAFARPVHHPADGDLLAVESSFSDSQQQTSETGNTPNDDPGSHG